MSIRLLAILMVLAASPTFAQNDVNAVQAEIEARYKGRVINLKTFPTGNSLRFDATGNLTRGGRNGSWTLYSGQLVTRISVKTAGIEIEGDRIIYLGEKTTGRLLPGRTSVRRVITIDLPGLLSPTSVNEAISNVFVESGDLAAYVPDYWKKYLLRNVGAIPEKFECDASETFASVIGTVVPVRPSDASGENIQPAAILKQVRPKYPDEAKQFRIAGVVGLDVVISETGDISEMHITHPAGGGLDESAVEAVREWKYSPTLMDGKPVPVLTCVTVNYAFSQ